VPLPRSEEEEAKSGIGARATTKQTMGTKLSAACGGKN
jgi:hypothetical protein